MPQVKPGPQIKPTLRGLPYSGLAEQDSSRPAANSRALDEPVWIHYTSCTTGDRKGVVSCQRGWLWSATASYAPVPGISSEDHLLWPLPLFHALGHSLCGSRDNSARRQLSPASVRAAA
jgi:acyl-coenzyme A synthetase/AMP-(fatty) acid ligase